MRLKSMWYLFQHTLLEEQKDSQASWLSSLWCS